MKIGILQTGHAPDALIETLGDYDAMFQDLLSTGDFTFETYDVEAMQFPDSPEAADGWLITGSKHGAYEDHPFIAPLEDLIRAVRATGRPMIGICFGHQIIAQALGGKVEKFPGGWSVGRAEYQTDTGPVAVNAWHQDQVVTPPEGAQVVASSDFCTHAALLYDTQIWTLQAHPEFSSDFVAGLLRTRGPGLVPDPLLRQAQDQLNTPVDRLAVGAQMVSFFKKDCSQ